MDSVDLTQITPLLIQLRFLAAVVAFTGCLNIGFWVWHTWVVAKNQDDVS